MLLFPYRKLFRETSNKSERDSVERNLWVLVLYRCFIEAQGVSAWLNETAPRIFVLLFLA